MMDDLMTSTNDSVVDIFTKISHHRNVSVVYLNQNLFYKNKQTRTLSLNSHYIVLLKNARDETQVANLARQMYPAKVDLWSKRLKMQRVLHTDTYWSILNKQPMTNFDLEPVSSPKICNTFTLESNM